MLFIYLQLSFIRSHGKVHTTHLYFTGVTNSDYMNKWSIEEMYNLTSLSYLWLEGRESQLVVDAEHVAVQSGHVGRAEAARVFFGAVEGVLLHVEERQRGRVSAVNRVHVRRPRVDRRQERPRRLGEAQGTLHHGPSLGREIDLQLLTLILGLQLTLIL